MSSQNDPGFSTFGMTDAEISHWKHYIDKYKRTPETTKQQEELPVLRRIADFNDDITDEEMDIAIFKEQK
jgi:hypothetical protein